MGIEHPLILFSISFDQVFIPFDAEAFVLVLLVLFWATGYHTSQWIFLRTNCQGGEGL